MTSQLKTSVTINDSAVADGQTIDAADVTVAFDDTQTELQEGWSRVSANDTHVKHLEDAVTSGTGISVTTNNDGANETLTVAVDDTVVATTTNSLTMSGKTLTTPTIADFTNATHDHEDAAGGGKIKVAAIDSQTATNGFVMTADGTGGASWAASAGGGAQPVDITVTAGEALSLRDYVFVDTSDGQAYKVDIDATPIKCGRLRGFVTESGGIASAGTGTVRILGDVTGFSGLTAWQPVYASATAGGYTQTKPSPSSGGAQVAIVPAGVATSTTAILTLNQEMVQYMKRDSVSDDGTLTITHHADALGYNRRLDAYIADTGAGSSLAAYADSNQDSDVGIQQNIGATYGSDTTGSGTASASSTYQTYAAANAVDNDADLEWASDQSDTAWWQYDFGSGNDKTIVRLIMTAPDSNAAFPSGNERMPGDFTLLASNTGAFSGEETTLLTRTGETWSYQESKTFDFTNTTAFRYYRVDITGKEDSLGRSAEYLIGEIELIEFATFEADTQLAQSFQVTGAQTPATVDLWLKKVGSPTGNLTVEIQADSTGEPSGTAISNGTSGTVAASTLGTSYGNITFTFGTPPSLSGSTTYWLVLKTTDSASQTNYIQWGADGSTPSYADGEMLSYDGSSWNAESKDAIFEVFGPGTNFVEPANGGFSTAGTTDGAPRVVYAHHDGSYADASTKSTVKNVSGGSLDLTFVVEVE